MLKRQSSQERIAWNAELKQWRLLFEKQVAMLTANHAPPAPAASGQRPGRSSAPTDPVLGSVIAQFESLHKDTTDRAEQPPADSH
jgi:hypothetical protein